MILNFKPATFFFLLALLFHSFATHAQEDRFAIMEQRMVNLAQNIPGLNQKVATSISNSTLQEFLKGLAVTHNLNFNIDPSLSQRVSSTFSNESVLNILLYLAKQYDLEFIFTGSIISIRPYINPLAHLQPKPKELLITFNPVDQTITMDLQGDTLLNVAKKITQITNKNIVVLPEIFYKSVTGYFQNMPLQNALEKLAITNTFKLNKTNDDVLILEPLKQDEEIATKVISPKNPNYTVKRVNRANNQSYSVQGNTDSSGNYLISLNVINSPIRDIIKNIAEQAGINYFIYSELTGTTTANIQNMPFDTVMSYVLQGTNYTYNIENGIYMIGERRNEGLRANRVVQLKFRSVDSLLAVIPNELKAGVEIREFKELNSFLLSGSLPQIKEIEIFLKQIDRVVPMVMIEVILMDIQKSKTISTGIKMGVSDSVRTGGNILGGPGLDFTFGSGDINRFIDQIGLNNVFNIGRVTPRFYISLKALEANSNIDLRQTPKLATLNGHKASLSIGSKRYYSVTTQNVLGSLNPQTVVTEEYKPVEANLAIDIYPFVSGDDQVTLNINVDISDFIGNPPNNAPPPSATSKFNSIIRVKNEEMIILGGIERNEKSESGSGVPLLSRIPIIKWLFSSKEKTNSKTVSVVFIKPTIIY